MTRSIHLFKAAAIAAAIVLTPGTVRGQAWPRFLGENYDGVAKDVGIDWTVEPSLLWSLRVGDGYGIGSVDNERFFQMDAGAAPAGDNRQIGQSVERLRCIDMKSGDTIWTKNESFVYSDLLGYEDGPRSSPTVVGELVYTLGVTGNLICRKVSDGETVWSVDTNKEYGVVQNFFGVGSSPLVLGDKLIAMIGGSPPEDQNIAPMRLDRVISNGSAVVAFDRRTGKEIWRCGKDLASYSSPRPIDIDGKTLVLVFAREGLMAIDPDKGEVRWRYDHRAEILESVNAAVPVVVQDKVFVSECYQVGSVLLKAGWDNREEVWKDPDNRRLQSFRAHWSTPVVVDGNLYGCSGRNAPDSDFRCIDFETGKVRWVDPRRIRSSVARVGDHLLVLEERGLLQVVRPNPEKLEVVAEWQLFNAKGNRPALQYPCWAAPVVVGDRLLVRGTDHVLCLKLARK